MAGFFPLFFKGFWSSGVDTTISTARLGMANSISGLFIAIFAPLLGAIADRGSSKKKFLFFFAYLGIVMTMGLFFVGEGNWPMAVFLYIFAAIGFSGGNIFYDSLIIFVSPKNKIDIVSAFGFSLGYLGGGILFAINVLMTLRPEIFGLENAASAIKVSFIMVGLWWSIFSLPVFFFVKEPEGQKGLSRGKTITAGYHQLIGTFKQIRLHKNIFIFLLAYWFYIDGVDTIIRMAVDYGISIGLDHYQLIIAILITQFIGFPAAICFGIIGQKTGAKTAIFIAIFVYLCISIWAFFINHISEFYTLAFIIGLVQGGIQALSRSFFTRIIPKENAAEYFGFFNMVGKFGVIIGPMLIGLTGIFFKYMGMSSEISSRASISSIAILFIIGGILLCYAKESEFKT